ncbi:MAG TPA: hypothetical protein VNI77_05895 [Nitrososphaera sp.]|nr:hypothetical protein [Nitrososphaera sp.]
MLPREVEMMTAGTGDHAFRVQPLQGKGAEILADMAICKQAQPGSVMGSTASSTRKRGIANCYRSLYQRAQGTEVLSASTRTRLSMSRRCRMEAAWSTGWKRTANRTSFSLEG